MDSNKGILFHLTLFIIMAAATDTNLRKTRAGHLIEAI